MIINNPIGTAVAGAAAGAGLSGGILAAAMMVGPGAPSMVLIGTAAYGGALCGGLIGGLLGIVRSERVMASVRVESDLERVA